MSTNNFKVRSQEELQNAPFFDSIFIFCEGKEEPSALVTIEVSCISLLGEALNIKKKKETIEEAYKNAFLKLIKDTQKSLTINFIDTEYERSKQGISKNCIN